MQTIHGKWAQMINFNSSISIITLNMMIQREILKDNNFQIGYKINKFISFAIAVTKSLTKPPYCDQHWGGGVEGILCVPVCCTDPGPCLVAEILLSPGTEVFSESLTLSFSMRLPSMPLKRVLHIKTSLCSLTSILFSRLERMLSRVLFFLLPQSLTLCHTAGTCSTSWSHLSLCSAP